MAFVGDSISFATTQLLTKKDQQILKTFPVELQKSLTCLLTASIGKTCQTVKQVLHIAVSTESTTIRDRLFLHLAKDDEESTHACLDKIQKIVEHGFFGQLMLKMDCPQKKYHSTEVIFQMIDNFYNNEFLVEKKHRREKMHAMQNKGFAPDSVISVVFRRILECRHFHQHSTLINEYISYAEESGFHLNNLYKNMIQQFRTKFESNFSESEKLKFVQVLCLVGSPNNLKTIFCYSELDIDDFLRQAYSLKYSAGEEVLTFFLNSVLRNNEIKFDEILRVLTLLVNFSSKDTFIEVMDRWQMKGCELKMLFEMLEAEAEPVKFELLNDIDQLGMRMSRFRQDPTVKIPLSDEDLELIKNQYVVVNNLCAKFCNFSFNQLVAEAARIREKAKANPISIDERLCLVAISRLAIRIHFGIYPYCTQVLALLGSLLGDKKRQAQVKTGEGKSTIVTMWVFVKAMECQSVDVNSTVRYLAIRDQLKYESFFKRCSIKTSHICYDEQIPAHFEAQVLYGPTFDFEFALMNDMLFRTNLFATRLSNPFVKDNFDCVCVDESDSLLVDAANSGARMSFPAEVSYDWVYAPLLSFIKKVSDPQSEASQEEKELFRLFQLSTQNWNLDALEFNPEMGIEKILLALMIDQKSKEIHKSFVANTRKYLLDQVSIQHQKACNELEDTKIYRWIISAIHALLNQKEKVDYVVTLERDDEGKVSRKIQIVDLKTGRILESSRWSDGIHEFLEIKHDITVEKESLNPLSYSHTVFFNKYKTITALTGTAERLQTKKIYGIESFDVPPHKPMIRIDEPARVTSGRPMFLRTVMEIISQMVNLRRPILVVCENIKESDAIAAEVKKQGFECQLLNEVQEELEAEVVAKAGIAGRITISTNTAGRGTDIILTEESLKNQGLFILLAFFASTEREELQDIGRGGRQGQPGGSVMVIDRESENIKQYLPDNKDLSDSELLAVLRDMRSRKEIAQSEAQFGKVELDYFLAKITDDVYDTIRGWIEKVENDSFLNKHCQRLNKLKLRQNRNFDFQHLPVKDSALAHQCVELLRKNTEILEWKLLLTSTVERIREKIIQKWAISFYQPVTSLMNKNRDVNVVKTEIQKRYNQFKQDWQKYLTPEGNGVFTYLEEITGIKLLK